MMESKVHYEDQNSWKPPVHAENHSGMSDRLIQWGIASSVEQANKILLGVVIVAVCITAFFSWHLLFGSYSGSRNGTIGLPIIPSGSHRNQ